LEQKQVKRENPFSSSTLGRTVGLVAREIGCRPSEIIFERGEVSKTEELLWDIKILEESAKVLRPPRSVKEKIQRKRAMRPPGSHR